MKLKELLQAVEYEKVIGKVEDKEIKIIVYDSRKAIPGSLFVAIKGFRLDGSRFVPQAVARGAVAVVGEDVVSFAPNFKDVVFVVVKNSRKALSALSNKWSGYPSKSAETIGVTGTNGKTTVVYMLRDVFKEFGKNAAIIGTTGVYSDKYKFPLDRTTPESFELALHMRRLVDSGVETIAMEVSSHALTQYRTADVDFDAAVFTNLTLDHLDYHKTPREYAEAKKILFDGLKKESVAVLNADDERAKFLARDCPSEKIVFTGRSKSASAIIEREEISFAGSKFDLIYEGKRYELEIPLVGRFNVDNAAQAFATAVSLGVPPETAAKALAKTKGAPGRLELVRLKNGAVGAVDYAHTPDALKKTLQTLKEAIDKSGEKSRIICVFGCGGDRDKGKRPVMGKIAGELADFVVITDDNPRTEDSQKIIEQIYRGIDKEAKKRTIVVSDRAEAIKYAVGFARSGDIVLVAGKGHENYQIIGSQTVPFSDKLELEKYA